MREPVKNEKSVVVDAAGDIYRRGMACLAGDGVPRDAATALKHLRQAAGHGHAGAHHELGQMLRFGEGTFADIDGAVIQYFAAAKGGSVDAMVVLGSLFESGDCLPQSLVFAHAFFGMAFASGVDDQSVSLAELEAVMKPEEIARAVDSRKSLTGAFGNGPAAS